MRRREFLGVVGGAATWPLAARAQQSVTPVIGFLNTTSPDTFASYAEAFREGLRTLGYIEGQNLAIEYRWASADYSRMPALAKELVDRSVVVIAATGDVMSARAAQQATATIPIVFTVGHEPVRVGLVTSLNRPDGNLTGITLFSSTLTVKRMEFLTHLLPRSRWIALLINPDNPNAAADVREAEEAGGVLDRRTVVVNARSPRDFETAFAAMMEQRADAALIGRDPMFLSERAVITEVAARLAVPVLYWEREFALAGGLVSYGPSVTWLYHQAGIYCGRILKGAHPAELPVLQATKFDLVINLRTAKALGVEFPPTLLALSDEVIE
jgi:putative ABC transport system substrate-binding protein